jgi:hypothetical protein
MSVEVGDDPYVSVQRGFRRPRNRQKDRYCTFGVGSIVTKPYEEKVEEQKI